jgi:serine/threonine-protein kinase
MRPERWRQIQDLYLDALERPPEERHAFLTEASAGDAELRVEVESLLEAAGAGDDLLDAPLEELVLLLDDADDRETPASRPRRAGPYAVMEEIGRGGMGAVYRACRDDGQYSREVALKLVHLVGAPDELARRFHRERQILAGLEHPNIARLYDAGVTDDGRPYLAMELVRGEAIHRYCDRLRLTIKQRLALFAQVLSAVDHAHRRLIIHRDLKPSNILVTEDGTVKLLDFGIAKLLEPEGGAPDGDDPLTRVDQRLLTPEFASPEQLRGEPLTTASDVYALGVLLHLILVGRRPPGVGEATASLLQDTGEAAQMRNTTPARLRKELRGELGTIVQQALRPEVAERYPTTFALLEDLTRYGAGLPITARPPSVAYRARKFVGRNRVVVAAASVTVLGLLGGLAVALDQARVARQERDVAESVSAFLENIFTASDPLDRSGERRDTLRIQAFLEQAVARLDSDLSDQPEVRVRMQEVLGSVHRSLGLNEAAERLQQASLDGYRDLKGGDSPEVARVTADLAQTLHAGGDPVASEERYREAMVLNQARFGERSREVAFVRTRFAGLLLTLDRLAEAEELLQKAVDVRREVFAEESPEMSDDLNLLGALQYRQGNLEAAGATMGLALEMNRTLLGPDHPNSAILAQNLGLLLHRLGRREEAEPLLRDAIASMRTAMGPDYPNIGPAEKTLANVLEALGRWPEADSLYKASIAFTRRVGGDRSRDLAIALHDYGGGLMRQGDAMGARALLEEAVEIERAVVGPRAPGTGVTLGTLAEARRRSGDAAEAEVLYRDALEILEAVFPPLHPRILAARGGLGLSLGDQGRTDEAQTLLLGTWEAARTLEDAGVAARDAAANLRRFYEAVGDTGEADRWGALADGKQSG